METSTLRWVLIIAGLALLAGLFLFGNPNKKRPPKRRATRSRRGKSKSENRRKPRDSAERQEPTLGGAPSLADEDGAEGDGAQGELNIDGGGDDGAGADSDDEGFPGPPPEKVVALYLKARDNRRIAGAELLEVALRSGMVFGPMDIFHRRHPGDDRPVFSLANLEKPGQFDRDAWNTLETRGLTLFMALPGPLGALDSWDAMLATGRRLGQLLHLDLLDEKREPFTRQREGEIREELRSWERSRQPEG